MVTNGYASRECLEFLRGLVDAMNIDLKVEWVCLCERESVRLCGYEREIVCLHEGVKWYAERERARKN